MLIYNSESQEVRYSEELISVGENEIAWIHVEDDHTKNVMDLIQNRFQPHQLVIDNLFREEL